jgi:deoxycytidylate deaminase
MERVLAQVLLNRRFGTCQRLFTASALIDYEYVILLMARNGTPHGQPHCKEYTTPDKRCEFCSHSETNLINFAARKGISMEGLAVVTSHRPCIACATNLVQAKVGSVYFYYPYISDGKYEYVRDLFQESFINFEHVLETKALRELEIMLDDWMKTW